jgi:hypothetical protein
MDKKNNKINNKTYWKCKKCGQEFVRIVDENRILLLNSKGQEIEVGFFYAKLICNKCGTKNSLSLDLPNHIENDIYKLKYLGTSSGQPLFSDLEGIVGRMYPINKTFFNLSSYFKIRLLKNLSFLQRKVYRWLVDNSSGEDIEDIYTYQKILKISKSLQLKPGLVNRHIKKIIEEILLLQPEKLTDRVKKFLEFKKLDKKTDIKFE